MKQIGLFIYLFFIGMLYGCESETIPSANPKLVGSIATRGSNDITSLPSGSQALFNASGGTNFENEIFNYDGKNWKAINGAEWQISSTSTMLTALYPAYNDQNLITDNPYNHNGLEDVLIAQSTFSNEKDINLSFRHLFSMFTIHVQSPLRESISAISIQSPQIEKLNADGSFSLSGTYQSIPELNSNGDYTFIIPPMENCNITLSFTIGEKIVSHTLTHTFKSGYKYECNVTDKKEPGIYSAEDLIEFSKIINKKKEGDLSVYGKEQEDGRWLFKLYADIDFSEINHSDLLPIGYDLQKPSIVFADIFDGNSYSISNLTIPDKSTNNDVIKDVSGLFGCIGEEGIVKNLHIKNARTTDNPTCTNVGGIASRNEGIIQDCSVQNSTLTSASEGFVGGICANLANGYIINCKSADNTITASKNSIVGGIIGGSYGKILNCYTYDNLFKLASGGYSGGIAGASSSQSTLDISNCYVKHANFLNKNWGAIIGTPQENKFVFDNVFYNGAKIIANTETTYENVHLYEKFSVDDKHISILLNQWIEETGKTKYQNLTFKNWTISTEITPNPAIFAE